MARDPLLFVFLEDRPSRERLPSPAPPRGRQLQRDTAPPVATTTASTSTTAPHRSNRAERTTGEFLTDRQAPRDVVIASSTSTASRKRKRGAAHVHDKMVGAQRNHKAHVLTNMKKLLPIWARYPGNEALYDIEGNPDPAVIKRIAHAAWSPENFFRVWTYMQGVVDYYQSADMGQYYMRTMFRGLALRIAKNERIRRAQGTAFGDADWKHVHVIYFAMPLNPVFEQVTRASFYEVPDRPKDRTRGRELEDMDLQAGIDAFEIDEEPPSPS
ncbi:hypothetical protein VPNG_06360 [Cytospora leucostoma]|uniref:Uncharacterized protein n=1 Tax=Cytospora leucostoma TaxID=1230097 RepID=A0A423X250_9PEZI|nr:hypothetical protein VPNG_06360 [Cytospora leucostoma]